MRSVVGAVISLAGAALAVRSLLLLIGRGRPRRGPQPRFVIAGPYVRMRNPALAGLVLALLGVAVWAGSAAANALALAGAIGAHAWVVTVEEPRLRARFGAAYAAYVDRVPRWVPRITTRRE